LSESNYAGSIIVNLAGLPDFLRKPILKKRMLEFFSMNEQERKEIINNALEAGPTIPFSKFAKLFKTWLEVLTTISEEQRTVLFSGYIDEVVNSPQKLINFNLDGILEIFLSLDDTKKEALAATINKIVSSLDAKTRNRLFLIIPDGAKSYIGF
jgi:hypothetical protein